MLLRPATIAATLLTLALPPGAHAAAQLRITPELGVGGGWASNLFVGSDFGPHLQGMLSPGLGAALSTGPVVKLFADYRYTWARYGADSSGHVHDATTTTRFRLSRAVDLDLDADFLALSSPVADPLATHATSSIGGLLSPILRWRLADDVTAEGGYAFTLRESTTAEDLPIREDAHELFAGASWRIGHRVEVGLRARHVSSHAPTFDAYSYDGDGATISGAWAPLGDLVLRGSIGLQWNRFSDDRDDRYTLASLAASWPISEHVAGELAWSIADNASTDEGFDGSRHLTWAGLRAELPWWP